MNAPEDNRPATLSPATGEGRGEVAMPDTLERLGSWRTNGKYDIGAAQRMTGVSALLSPVICAPDFMGKGFDNCKIASPLIQGESMNATQFIADCLTQTHLRLHATCEGLTAEQVLWRPAPTANNIGFILWHMGRHEDGRVTAMACGAEGFETGLWAAGGWHEWFGQPVTAPDPGDRLGLRSLAIPAPDVLLSYFRAVNERTMRFIESLDDDRLDAFITVDEPRQTVGGLLRHMIVHQNNHHGQVDYLRGLQQEDWDLPRGTGGILPNRSA